MAAPPILPARWSSLRRHLARVHAGTADRAARLTAAHRAWHAHHAAVARETKPAWFSDAEAAEDAAAARIEAQHRQIAAVPARSWSGLRLKLAIVWGRSARAPDGAERDDWDLSDEILWSALQDVLHAERSGSPRNPDRGI